jgi:putative hydrolase of the HAD superfamily
LKYYAEKPLGILKPGVIFTLKELKRRGYFLMTVSNKSYMNKSCLSEYCLNSYFDAEIYSYQIGYAKPDREIFQYAQKIANVSPEEIVHIGNSINSDIFGGKMENWHTILLQKDEKSKNEVMLCSAEPDYKITKLEQIITIIEKI